MKPQVHADSSAKLFGGKADDYLDIHQLMDSSKGAVGDHRHRTLTHNTWFLSIILEKIFGITRVNSDGKSYSVREVGEQHVLEDYGKKFIPTAQDFLQEMEVKPWMENGKTHPPSSAKLERKTITRKHWTFD